MSPRMLPPFLPPSACSRRRKKAYTFGSHDLDAWVRRNFRQINLQKCFGRVVAQCIQKRCFVDLKKDFEGRVHSFIEDVMRIEKGQGSSQEQMREMLELHGFKLNSTMDLTSLRIDVRSASVWLLLHEYKKAPIIWRDRLWVPVDDSYTAAEHLV